jgi:spermidine synthase
MTRARLPLRAVAPLFFLSGAVALGCEAAYFRGLALLFGASHEAAGALLAAFMGGIALGSEIGARVADRLRAPALGYAIAEAIVGAYAFVAPHVFAQAYEAAAHVGVVGRVGLAFVVLAAPTVAMGATLPLLAAAVVRSRAALREGVGALYTVNLAGGAVGAVVCGFVLLPRFGLRGTLVGLGVVAIGVAASAFAIGRARDPVAPVASSAELRAPEPPRDWLAPFVAAWIGVVSFALQVAYNRVLALLLGAAAYTFALIVTVILAATALGGLVAAREEEAAPIRGIDPYWTKVARRCLAIALTVYVGTLVVYAAPFYVAWAASRFASMTWVRVTLVALVVGAPSYQVGALFPALASRFPSTRVGHAAGRAVLACTVGNVAGALVAAFIAIPMRGVEWTLGMASAMALVPALVAGWRAGRIPFAGIAMASALACVLSLALRPAWDAAAMSAGSYRVRGYRASRATEGTKRNSDDCNGAPFTENRVLFFRDGPVGSVTVLGHAGGDHCSLYSLRVNGKAEGSVFVAAPLDARVPDDESRWLPLGDLPSEIFAGWLPAVAGPPPTETMLVGWGTGISARALLAAGARHVDAAELEPAVLDASALFDPATLHDPRVTIVIDDARMVLRRAAPSSFDVVVSHPSNPWVVGASALFSREYFALVRSRLKDGGRAATWIQLYEMDAESARSLVATFLEAFPDAHAFRASPSANDVFLVGIKSRAPTSREALAKTIASRVDARALAALHLAGIDDVAALLATDIAGPDDLVRYAAGAPASTDDSASLEYRIADHVLRGTGDDARAITAGLDRGSSPPR